MKILAKGNSKRTEEFKQKLLLLDCELVCVDENTNNLVKEGICLSSGKSPLFV
jgi:hypothetical protein